MTAHDDQPSRVDEAFAAHLEHRHGGPAPDLSALNDVELAEYERDVSTLNALDAAVYERPSLATDSIARHFGFDRPDSHVLLSGPRLREARQQASLKVTDLALAMARAGQPRPTKDLFAFETAQMSEVPMTLLTVLAGILGVSVADLEAPDSHLLDDFEQFLASEAFDAEISRWARVHASDAGELRTAARRELAGTSFRNVRHSQEQWLALLKAFLESRSR